MTKRVKTIKTINGETLLSSQCRRYESGFYKIGDPTIENSGDCYLMDNGNYYRFDTGLIVYDHYYKKYILKSSERNLTEGFINENLEIGYFTKNIHSVRVFTKDDGCKYAISEKILINNLEYRERVSDGHYYHISLLKASQFNKIEKVRQEYKYSLDYDAKKSLPKAIELYNKSYIEDENINKEIVNKIVKDYTFGLEFETTEGIIPNHKLYNIGLIPLRDGSISGLEYVTIPLAGSKGVSTIIDTVKELDKRTKYNDSCALHMHIGNIPRTKEFILAFIKTTCAIQDEIFNLFPLYKKYNFGYKNKNYAAPYDTYTIMSQLDPVIDDKNIDKNFDIIFRMLSGGYSIYDYGGDLSKVTHHPNDPSGNHKWNVSSRYVIHNVIPLIFGNKETVEFRIHTPTYDAGKILAFLFLNILIVDFVKNNTDQILKNSYISLQSILEYSNRSLDYNFYKRLKDYITQRRKYVESFNRNSDLFFKEERVKAVFNYEKLIYTQNIKDQNRISLDFIDNILSIKNIPYEKIKNVNPITVSDVLNQDNSDTGELPY